MGDRVVVVGGGIAGLVCARSLWRHGLEPLLLEASNAPGGRVRTDAVEGFRLDRGFQVLLTGYPEVASGLDLPALALRRFGPGACVRRDGRFERIGDPLRQPRDLFATLLARVGSWRDKWRILALRRRLQREPLSAIFSRPEETTLERLISLGFSEAVIEGFFRPFFGGVFLEDRLETSSRFFEFVFRTFAVGDASLPASGMGAIPRQLALSLPPGAIRCETRVASVSADGVLSDAGEQIPARAVVVAAGPTRSALLLGEEPPPMNGVTCLYYAAARPPTRRPLLHLNGEGRGQVNLVAVLDRVAPSYAPSGASLVSVSLQRARSESDEALDGLARAELLEWFGDAVQVWRLLRVYRIAEALPRQIPGDLEPIEQPVARDDGLFVAGDHLEIASLSGAMRAGRRAAAAVARSVGR